MRVGRRPAVGSRIPDAALRNCAPPHHVRALFVYIHPIYRRHIEQFFFIFHFLFSFYFSNRIRRVYIIIIVNERPYLKIQVRESSSWRESLKRSAMFTPVTAAEAADMQQQQKQRDRKPAATDPCRLVEEKLLEMPNAE